MTAPDDDDDAPSAAELAPLEVVARPESLPLLASYCQQAARRVGLDARTSYRLRLAVDELATNAITHGYGITAPRGRRAREPRLVLRVGACGDQMLSLVLEDRAPPFDPRTHTVSAAARSLPLEQRSVGGLGLFLVRRSVDALDYERVDGVNRTILTVFGQAQAAPRTAGDTHAARPARHEAHLVLAVGRPTRYRRLRHTLDVAGFALTVTRDVRELLRLLHVHGLRESAAASIDLVLVGRDLPQWASGVEQLRSDPRTSSVAVHLLVDRRHLFDEAFVEQGLALGADDCLPLSLPAALQVRRIDAAVERVRMLRELDALQRRKHELERIAHTLTGSVVPLGVSLADERDLQRLLGRVLGEAMGIARAQCGVLYVMDGEHAALDVAQVRLAARDLEPGGGANPEGATPLDEPLPLYDVAGQPRLHDPAVRAALMGETVVVADLERAGRPLDLARVRALERRSAGELEARSLLAVALRAGAHTLGVMLLIGGAASQAVDDGAGFAASGYHRAVIESLASQAALALHHRALLAERQSLRALEHELELARQVQQSFLPSSLPQLEGWAVAARLDPARTVSGDFYDTFELTPQGAQAFVVADVCDKGASAAFFMGLTRSLLRAFAQRGAGAEAGAAPGAILHAAISLTNDYIATHHAELSMFATMFFAVLEPAPGRVSYVNAGHPAALVLETASGRVRAELGRTGPAIGIVPQAHFALGTVEVAAGETLFAYTDGVSEARDAQGRFLGRAALLEHLRRAAGQGAEALVEGVMALVEDHAGAAPQHDDIALLAVQRLA